MVRVFRGNDGKLNVAVIFSSSIIVLLTIVASWLMFSYMLDETVQEVLYPYSGHPLIVYSVGEVLTFPGWAALCLITLLIVNQVLFELLNKSFFVKMRLRLQQLIGAILIISVILIIAEFIGWPMAAKAHGYSPCPYDTLLFGQKTSTAWVKDVSLCYDKEVIKRFPTGSYEQVLDVAQYLGSQHINTKKVNCSILKT